VTKSDVFRFNSNNNLKTMKKNTMTEKINLRIDKQQKFEFKKKAILNDMSLSSYIRELIFKLNQ
jgi:predicted HicB family RNase H-like nuclease